MKNRLERYTVRFGHRELMEDEMLSKLCGLLENEPRDFVEFVNLHLLNGVFHLLTDTNKVWNEIQKDEMSSILDPADNKISAESFQPNLQPFSDTAMYVIYKVADSKNVKLEKDKITKMVRGLAGYSISLFRSWAEATESSKSRASLSLSATLILKKLEKLKEMHSKTDS